MNWWSFTRSDDELHFDDEAFQIPLSVPRRYVITGLPENGKTTFAGFLAESIGEQYADTSDFIYQELAKEWGVTVKELRARKKSDIRADLVRKGNEVCDRDHAALANGIINQGINIVCGVRRVKEYQAIYGDPTLIWIECPDRPKIPDNTEERLRDVADLVLSFKDKDLDTMRAVAQSIRN